MKDKKLTITNVLLAICVSAVVMGCASKTAGYYEYPTEGSGAMLLQACRIPEDTLDAMNEEQLAQAVADFPFLVDIYLGATHEAGVEHLPESCDAYKELLTRKDAKSALIAKAKELESKAGGNEELWMTAEMLKYVVSYESAFADTLTEEEMEYLKN